MRVSVGHDPGLSESYLRKMSQLGVDCIDFGSGDWFPGVKEQGYPDLDELVRIRRRLRSWGMDWNRVTLPDITEAFFLDRDGAERELENSAAALAVFAEAGAPIARQRCEGDTFNHLLFATTGRCTGAATSGPGIRSWEDAPTSCRSRS